MKKSSRFLLAILVVVALAGVTAGCWPEGATGHEADDLNRPAWLMGCLKSCRRLDEPCREACFAQYGE